MAAPGQQTMHGNSKYIVTNDKMLGSLTFMDFAPAPCSCCACLAPQVAKDRMYAKIYDNRGHWNLPLAPFMCCTCDEKCIIDRPYTLFHDRPPSRAGMCCWVIPCTCCGPPVIFVKKPMCCCCIPMTDYFGDTIAAAPCNVFGLKKWLCCGGPCYLSYSYPLLNGVKDGKNFLIAWKVALNEYYKTNGIDEKEKAIFESVMDSEIDQYKAQTIGGPAVVAQPIGASA